VVLFLAGCQPNPSTLPGEDYVQLRQEIVSEFSSRTPKLWSEVVPGVKTRLDTKDRVIALTLDACGSTNDGYDAELIDYLIANKIKATLFINARWIDKNLQAFKQLAANPLFEIENHGMMHKPASVNGNSAFGIAGTDNPGELVDEIELNAGKIEELTGRRPHSYRSGTAFYDEVALDIIQALGYEAVGFSILGDKGATYSKEEIREALLTSQPGSIIICHMNHPEKETAEGLKMALPELKRRGFIFVKLSEYKLN